MSNFAFALNKIKPKSVKRKLPRGYRAGANEAYARALNRQYGSHGAASPVRRIDPNSGGVSIEADCVRKRIGEEYAQKL